MFQTILNTKLLFKQAFPSLPKLVSSSEQPSGNNETKQNLSTKQLSSRVLSTRVLSTRALSTKELSTRALSSKGLSTKSSQSTKSNKSISSRGRTNPQRRTSYGMESGNFLKQKTTIQHYFHHFLTSNTHNPQQQSTKEISIHAFVDLLLFPYFIEEENPQKTLIYPTMNEFLRILTSISLDPLSWLDTIAMRKGQTSYIPLTIIEFEREIHDLIKITKEQSMNSQDIQLLFDYFTNHLINPQNTILQSYHMYAGWKKFTTKISKIKSLNAAANYLYKFHRILTLTNTTIEQLLPLITNNTVIQYNELPMIIETLMIKIQELEDSMEEDKQSLSTVLLETSSSLPMLSPILQQTQQPDQQPDKELNKLTQITPRRSPSQSPQQLPSMETLNSTCDNHQPFLINNKESVVDSTINTTLSNKSILSDEKIFNETNIETNEMNESTGIHNKDNKPKTFDVNESFACHLYEHERKVLNQLVESLVEGEQELQTNKDHIHNNNNHHHHPHHLINHENIDSRSSMIVPCRASFVASTPIPITTSTNSSTNTSTNPSNNTSVNTPTSNRASSTSTLPNISGIHHKSSKNRMKFSMGSNDEYELTEASGRYFPGINHSPQQLQSQSHLQSQLQPQEMKLSSEGYHQQSLLSSEPLLSRNLPIIQSTNPTKVTRLPKLNDFLENADFRLGYVRSRLNNIW